MDKWNGYAKIDVPSLGNYALSEYEDDGYKTDSDNDGTATEDYVYNTI